MIRMAGKQRQSTINLLGGHNPRQPMRPSHSAEGKDERGLGAKIPVKPVRPAEDHGKTAGAALTPTVEARGKTRRAQAFACRVTRDEARRSAGEVPKQTPNRLGFFRLSVLRPAAAAFLDLMHINAHAEATPDARRAREILVNKLTFRPGLDPADADQM